MKFAVLSLNPGVDRVLYLPQVLHPGELNRTCRSVTSQGSKGANVAIMLHRLGADVEYYSFSGGTYGALCESYLAAAGVRSHYVNTGCGVRMNTKVIDAAGVCTELNERGGVFSAAETASLAELFTGTDAGAVCLCGSIPQGVEKDVYNSLIGWARAAGKLAVLDCDGEAMKLGIEARPHIIKPNLHELEQLGEATGLFGSFPQGKSGTFPYNQQGVGDTGVQAVEKRREIEKACMLLRDNYGCEVLCTLGGEGAVYCGAEGTAFQPAARVRMLGFSGAGDCFLAGYLAARYDKGFTAERSLLCAAAAGGAKVALEGTLLPGALAVDELVDGFDNPGDPYAELRRKRSVEELILEGIEPWNLKEICHTKTRKS